MCLIIAGARSDASHHGSAGRPITYGGRIHRRLPKPAACSELTMAVQAIDGEATQYLTWKGGRLLSENRRLNRRQRLIEIGDDVVDMLDAERKPDISIGYARLQLLLR